MFSWAKPLRSKLKARVERFVWFFWFKNLNQSIIKNNTFLDYAFSNCATLFILLYIHLHKTWIDDFFFIELFQYILLSICLHNLPRKTLAFKFIYWNLLVFDCKNKIPSIWWFQLERINYNIITVVECCICVVKMSQLTIVFLCQFYSFVLTVEQKKNIQLNQIVFLFVCVV